MSQLRYDPLHDQWVVFCPERLHRPQAFVHPVSPSFQNNPFAPGMEFQTPSEVDAIRPEGSPPNASDWTLRAFPNRYPAFVSQPNSTASTPPPFESQPAFGGHEVIIETNDPRLPFHELSLDQMLQLLCMWQRRIQHWNQVSGIQAVQLFKNTGWAAGASLPHPHSQLTALPIVPPRLARMLTFLEKNPTDYWSDLIQTETKLTERIVHSTEDWITLSPYAGRFPYEMRIVPQHAFPDYATLTSSALESLAITLKSITQALHQILENPPFNLILHTLPVHATMEQRNRFRCHFELFPRISGIAGFELGTGLWMNSVLPETAAKSLSL